jgi:release factor glutamine methyltransferase
VRPTPERASSAQGHEQSVNAGGRVQAPNVDDAPFPMWPRDGALSIADARRRLTRVFRQRELDSPELDARLLVGHALGLDHTALAAQAHRALSFNDAESIVALARRRLAHEPIARIVGRKEFWGLSFSLNRETFVPRPESETVVAAILGFLSHPRTKARSVRIADLGTGSGALLLAILSELPNDTWGFGTDTSLGALDCARANAAAHRIRASFVACNYAAAIGAPVDVIVSNPPYIPRAELARLAPEVQAFDPRRALDGGEDGLDAYRVIAAQARRILASNGLLVVELGYGQAEPVHSLFAAAGLVCQEVRPDLSGIPRALLARPLP